MLKAIKWTVIIEWTIYYYDEKFQELAFEKTILSIRRMKVKEWYRVKESRRQGRGEPLLAGEQGSYARNFDWFTYAQV